MNKAVNFDVFDALLYAAAPYAGKNELNEFLSATGEGLISKVQDKIYKKLCKERKYYAKNENYSPVREAFKRVAIIILITMSIGFTCVLSVDAAREALWEAIIEWSENYFHFQYKPNDEVVEAPTEILEYKEPTVDGRFERYEIYKDSDLYIIEYEYKDKLITYNQKPLHEYSTYISNLETELVEIYVNTNKGFKLIEKLDNDTQFGILWNDGRYAYTLFGNIEYEELLKIAESIK